MTATLGWIVASGLLMSLLALSGSLTLLLPRPWFDRLVLPLVALAAGSLLGGALFVMVPAASAKLCGKILKDAEARGVDCIAVACPLCQSNLDTKQDEIRAEFNISRAIPVVFVTQLMGLAFGIDEKDLKFESSIVPFELKPAGATT